MIETKYLRIPISVLGEAFTNPTEFCDTIYSVGILNAAKALDTTLHSAVAQCFYHFVFTGDLPKIIRDAIDELIDQHYLEAEQIEWWLDSRTKKYNIDVEAMNAICDLLGNEIFALHDEPFAMMLPEFVLFGRLQLALYHLGVGGSAVGIFDKCSELETKYGDMSNTPFAPLPIDKFYNFADGWQNLNEDDLAIFVGYLSTLSILGKKSYTETTIPCIVGRMIGKANEDEVAGLLTADRLKSTFDYWTSRRRSEYLLSELKERYGLQRVTSNRSIGISYRLNEKQLEQRIRAKVGC